MAMAERRLAKATHPGSRRPGMELRREAPDDLSWEAAIRIFVEGWAADHPGIRPTTLGHYREQLANRIAAFAKERGITSVQDFSRHDLRAFVVWLDGFVTANGRPLTSRGKDMALATAKRFLGWLYQERLLAEDIAAQVGTYRLDTDPEPRATPSADLEKVLSSLDLSRPTGIRNMAMIHLMAFCGLRVGEMVGLNASDLDLEEGRVRVKAETSKVRRRRFVDLPLTLSDGKEVVKPEVAELMASWLRLRSHACPHLGEDVATNACSVEWNQRDMYRQGGIGYTWGERYGQPYRYQGLSQGFRPGERWSAALSLERSYSPELDDAGNVIPPELSRQLVLTTSYDLSEEKTLSARLVRRASDTNFYVAYRQRVRKGMDLLMVAGDPNADKWVSRLAAKAMWCL